MNTPSSSICFSPRDENDTNSIQGKNSDSLYKYSPYYQHLQEIFPSPDNISETSSLTYSNDIHTVYCKEDISLKSKVSSIKSSPITNSLTGIDYCFSEYNNDCSESYLGIKRKFSSDSDLESLQPPKSNNTYYPSDVMENLLALEKNILNYKYNKISANEYFNVYNEKFDLLIKAHFKFLGTMSAGEDKELLTDYIGNRFGDIKRDHEKITSDYDKEHEESEEESLVIPAPLNYDLIYDFSNSSPAAMANYIVITNNKLAKERLRKKFYLNRLRFRKARLAIIMKKK